MIKTTCPQVVVKHICLLGEGPVWDTKRNLICWIDILKGEIHEYSPGQKILRTIQVHQYIGSLAICKNGNFLVALKNGFGFVDRESGELSIVTNPEAHLPYNRFNDGKCDPKGRFWAGTMSQSEEPKAGSLYLLEKDLSVTKKIEEVTISNGMAWSADHKTFYYIDTPESTVVSYWFDKNTGHIHNKKVVIRIPKEEGYPDGMTIDKEDMLWIAHWDGWQLSRWNPANGEKLCSIPLPVSRPTSCTFGGKNLEDLYITSASVGLSEHELQDQPLAGSLFMLADCGYKGTPAFEFDV